MSELTEQLARHRDPVGILDGGVPTMPSEEELKNVYVAPGEPALLPIGIAYYAFWEDPADGMARHARAQVSALAKSGLPVSLRSTTGAARYMLDAELDEQVKGEVGYLRNVSLDETALAIRQLVIGSARQLDWTICPAGARTAGFEQAVKVYEGTVVYTSWERSTVDKAVVAVLNRCAEVWVPCERNRQVFADAGVERVWRVPCPFDPAVEARGPLWRLGDELCRMRDEGLPSVRFDDPRIAPLLAKLQGAAVGAPWGSENIPEGKRFYAIGKWEPRKGYDALLGAFLLAFSPKDKASLFIKTSGWARWEGYPTPDESLAKWRSDSRVSSRWSQAQIARRVRIVSAKLPVEKISDIHRENNIYVSCSHGEAFDLPAADAVRSGNALVHVGYGGTEDYAPAGSIRVPWKLGPVHKGYGWEPEAEWAEYTEGDLVEALRSAEPPMRRVQPPDLYQRFGMVEVGRMMRERILGSEAREWLGMLSDDVAARLERAGGFG